MDKGPVMAAVQDVKLAEHGSRRWIATAKEAHTLADVKHPAYLWARAARSGRDGIAPFHIVEIVHERHQFYVELYVVAVDPGTHSVRCHVLREIPFDKNSLPKPDLSAARVEFKGAAKWCVINGTDVLSKGHSTKESAEAWLAKKVAGE